MLSMRFVILMVLVSVEVSRTETISGCTVTSENRFQLTTNRTFIDFSCENGGLILVENLMFGVHQSSSSKTNKRCSFEPGDCTTRTTFIGMECNGLNNCQLDLNAQYLHICSQYSDYMILNYSCLQGQSLSICENHFISTTSIDGEHRAFLRSTNYPFEYESSLNCSCRIDASTVEMNFLDFYLEERDENNECSRDFLKIDNEYFCDSDSMKTIRLNSSINIKFETNEQITRKGFWLTMKSSEPIEISCRNGDSLPSSISSTKTMKNNSTSRSSLIFVSIVLLMLILNFVLIYFCWQRIRSKNEKLSSSKLSSSSSFSSGSISCKKSTNIDGPKNEFFRILHRPSTTNSVRTGTTALYEDPVEPNHLENENQICSFVVPTCSLINFPCHRTTLCHCHLSTNEHYTCDSMHVYETIRERSCVYQRMNNLTLNRLCLHQSKQTKTIENTPETLV